MQFSAPVIVFATNFCNQFCYFSLLLFLLEHAADEHVCTSVAVCSVTERLSPFEGEFQTVEYDPTASHLLSPPPPKQQQGSNGLSLMPCTLARIYAGIITTWDNAEILASNPLIASIIPPGTPIVALRRSKASGSTAAVSAYLNV